jgi:hypothetical protein
MTKPITPTEAENKAMPDQVIESFNQLITENYARGKATVYQNAVVDLIVAKMNISRTQFNNNWLNVESVYERAGWKVSYDKPGWNESGVAFYVFEKRVD